MTTTGTSKANYGKIDRAPHMLADLIPSGQVGLVDSRAPDLSIDEIVLLIMSEVRRPAHLGQRR